jgi:hypothetical protein
MRLRRFQVLASYMLLLVVAFPCWAQNPPGPRTLERRLQSDDAQGTPAASGAEAANAGPMRPAGIATRPDKGVQHPDLDKAWAKYSAIVSNAAEEIRAAISKQFDAATAKGNLDAAEKWQAALAKFEKTGEMPTANETKAAVNAALADYKKATEDLSKEYEAVIKDLTMAKRIKEAKVARDECETFRPKGLPPKPPKAFGMLVGSRWKYHPRGKTVFTLGEKGEILKLDGTRSGLWSIEGNVVRLRELEGKWEDVMVVSPDGTMMAGKNNDGKPVAATRVRE